MTSLGKKRISVVLVDDQVEVRISLRRALDRDGRFIILAEAKDGPEALRKVGLLKPDTIILDLAMPGLNGLEVIPQIQEHSPRTRVVVLSGMTALTGVRDRVLDLGATSVLDKPVSPKEVIARLLEATASQA